MLEGVTSTPISDSIGDGPLSAKNVTEGLAGCPLYVLSLLVTEAFF